MEPLGESERSRVSRLTLRFNTDVAASLTANDVVLLNLTTGNLITPDKLALSYSVTTREAVLTFPGVANQILPDGVYRLRMDAGAVVSATGKPLGQDLISEFHVLRGDANGDRTTNQLDLYYIWQNLYKAPAARDLNADLNGDGQVTVADLDVVRSNYLARLTPFAKRLAGDVNRDGAVNEFDLFAIWSDLRKPIHSRDLAKDLNGDGRVTVEDLEVVKSNYPSRGSTLTLASSNRPSAPPLALPESSRAAAPSRGRDL